MDLRIDSKTSSVAKVSWSPVPGGKAVRFMVDGKPVSSSWSPDQYVQSDGRAHASLGIKPDTQTISVLVLTGGDQGDVSLAAPDPVPVPSTTTWPNNVFTKEPWHYASSPTGLAVDAHSADYVANLLAQIKAHGAFIACKDYSVPVFEAPAGTPKKNISVANGDLASFNPNAVPSGVVPAAGSDAHAAVLDYARRMEEGGYHVTAGFASCSYGHGISFDAINTGGTAGANDANFPHCAGLLVPEHFTGLVPITGMLAYCCLRGNGPIRWPSCKPGAHNTSEQYGPTNGMVFRFKSGATYSGPSWKMLLFKALQTYGMACRDGSSNFTLFAEDTAKSGRHAPAYPWQVGTNPDISDLPWSQLECISTLPAGMPHMQVEAKAKARG